MSLDSAKANSKCLWDMKNFLSTKLSTDCLVGNALKVFPHSFPTSFITDGTCFVATFRFVEFIAHSTSLPANLWWLPWPYGLQQAAWDEEFYLSVDSVGQT